jgi:hypothetical protein
MNIFSIVDMAILYCYNSIYYIISKIFLFFFSQCCLKDWNRINITMSDKDLKWVCLKKNLASRIFLHKIMFNNMYDYVHTLTPLFETNVSWTVATWWLHLETSFCTQCMYFVFVLAIHWDKIIWFLHEIRQSVWIHFFLFKGY